MSIVPLDSIDDPRVDVYRRLNQSNLTRVSGLFIAEGEKLVRRLLTSSFRVHSLLVDERFAARIMNDVPEGVPVYQADRAQIEQVVGFNFHRGVLGCGHRPTERSLEQCVPPPPGPAAIVVCADVQDPENLGGMLRSSAALGADAVILGPRCADPFSRRVLRVSMGTAFKVPIREATDLLSDLRALRDSLQVEVLATVLHEDAVPLARVRAPARVALVFGSEGYGLPPECLELCQQQITIPMHRQTDSLNVSVAAGIFIHHFASRRARDASSEYG